jgi:hypothetical protein
MTMWIPFNKNTTINNPIIFQQFYRIVSVVQNSIDGYQISRDVCVLLTKLNICLKG